MKHIYKNITGNTAEILDLMDYNSNIFPRVINFANIHASDSVTLDLYLSTSEDLTKRDKYDGEDTLVEGEAFLERQTASYKANIKKDSNFHEDLTNHNYNDGSNLVYNANNDYTENIVRNTYYIVKGLVIPNATSIQFDYKDLQHDKSIYNLYIKLNASDSAVDVIIIPDTLISSAAPSGNVNITYGAPVITNEQQE